jgi:1-acyl-sn-glycerol-3-phosphate acyltransferase
METKLDKLRGANPVNRLFYTFIALWLTPAVRYIFKLQIVRRDILPCCGPAIVVANHVNFFDPIWIYAVIDRPMHFVATEELFRSRFLAFLLRLFGTFPIRKAARDFQSVKNLIDVLRRGGLIGLYPEGTRTWDGTNGPVIPTIARIIRRMKVPVYSCRLEGAYLHFPRWADKWRPIPVRLVFNQLYTRESIPASESQILADIAEEIRIKDYELKIPGLGRRVSGLASGVDKLLYRCPHCQSLESLKAVAPPASNRVECQSCYATWNVDLGSRLTPIDDRGEPSGKARTAAELYGQVKTMPLKPIRSSLIQLEAGEKLYLVSRPHFLYREKRYPNLRLFGFGRAFLTDRRFLFRGRLKRKGRVRLSVPLEQVDSLSVEPGDKLHFMHRGILYRIPIRGESPLKWYDFMERLTESRRANRP